jgi:hypothetical protein
VQVGDHDSLWTAVAQLLKDQVSEAVWFSTFHDIVALDGDPSILRLSAPNSPARDRIMSRYLPLVRDALDDLGEGSRQLLVEVQTVASFVDEPADVVAVGANGPLIGYGSNGQTLSGLAEAHEAHRQSNMVDSAGLNPRYTFETFVKGASNQFALAAALRVAETPGRSYNPLFIYGAAGLGKTHLLHAIGHYVHHHYQHDLVRYVSTETFLNEYVDGIRTNTIANFKRRYRDIDVLLIDDIQFMEGKEGLQEEFFHTFNSLPRREQADRDLERPDAGRDPDARGAPRGPLQVGPHHRRPAARPRDAPRDLAQQGRARPQPGAVGDARADRVTDHEQHPRARGRAHPRHRVRELNNVPISTHLAGAVLSDCSPTRS